MWMQHGKKETRTKFYASLWLFGVFCALSHIHTPSVTQRASIYIPHRQSLDRLLVTPMNLGKGRRGRNGPDERRRGKTRYINAYFKYYNLHSSNDLRLVREKLCCLFKTANSTCNGNRITWHVWAIMGKTEFTPHSFQRASNIKNIQWRALFNTL